MDTKQKVNNHTYSQLATPHTELGMIDNKLIDQIDNCHNDVNLTIQF
jgi:hypothetical protein